MTALVDDVIRNSNPLGNEKLPLYLRGNTGDVFLFSLMGQRFGSALLEPMSERADLLCRGLALANVPDPGAGVNTSPCVVIAGRASGFDNSEGDDEITESHIGRLVYAVDDNTLALTNGDTGGGPTRSPAGYFQGFEVMAGVTTLVLLVPDPFEEAVAILQGVGGGGDSAPLQDAILHVMRGVVTSNVASLAAFTVAGNDGLTYAEDDLVFLAAQTTDTQSGPYVVGEVAAGVAPLTRPSWWATASVQAAGAMFAMNEGTTGKGLIFYATLAGDITVGTSNPAFKIWPTWLSRRQVRGVVEGNIADLATFTVASNDGLTYTAGQIALLVGQTTAAQDGPYIVGTVGGGTAPLTRPAWWYTGHVAAQGFTFEVNEGTEWHGSEWFASLAGAITVGTSAPEFYPREHRGVSAAMTGTPGAIAVSDLWLLTGGEVLYSRKVTGGTPGHISTGATTPGDGDGAVTFTSTANETSTISYCVKN